MDSEILKKKTIGLLQTCHLLLKSISTQIHSPLINNGIVDHFQSAYKAAHNCETDLLSV